MRNTEVIAQKEFADHLYSPSFRILLGVFTFVILSMNVLSAKNGCELFNQGFSFIDVAQAITLFLPVLGFALGFDLVIKEKRSKSLNTLLTHPVFRDNIISGKIIGGLGALILVVLSLLSTLVIAIFAVTYREILPTVFYSQAGELPTPLSSVLEGFYSTSLMMTWFSPLVGIALSFKGLEPITNSSDFLFYVHHLILILSQYNIALEAV